MSGDFDLLQLYEIARLLNLDVSIKNPNTIALSRSLVDMDKLIERPGTPALKGSGSLSRISSLSRGFASRSLASLSSSSLSSMARKLDFKSLEYSSRINLGTPSPAFDDISIGSTSSNFNPGLNLPLILKVDPNFALFQFGKRLLYKINAFRMYLELKHHHGVLPKLENIIAYGSKVLKSYSKNPHDYDEELNSYFKIPGSSILSALDDVFLALNVEQKDLLESKIKPDLTFEDHKAGNKVLKLVQSVCISSLKLNGHKPPPFTKLESILFIAYPEAVSDTYTSEVDITQLASRDRIWAPILEDIITNKGEVLEVSTSKRASLRLALFLNKLDTVLENPSKYVRPHPFYLHWAALSADEVVEKGGVYSFSCKSGKDRTSMAVEVRAVHFAIKAVNMVFKEIRSTTDTFDSNLIKLARQKLEKLKVKVIHKKVSELTPAQVKEFYSVYGFTKSRKPQWYTKMHPDLQRLLDQALSKCFVADGKALNIDDSDDYNLIKQKLDIHLGWDSPLGQYLPIATNLFKIEFRASMYDRVILFETAFRHGALVKNEMMGDPPEIQRVSNLIYGQITNAMLDGIPRNSLDTVEPHELRLITLLTPLKILNPVKDDNKDFLKHMDKARESTIKNYSHRKANSKNYVSIFYNSRKLVCNLTSSIVPVDTGFAPLQDAHMIREYCSVDNLNTIEELTDGISYDLQDMVSFLIYDDLFDADLQRRVLFESLSFLLKDLCSSVLASGCGDLVPAIFGAGIKGRLKRGGLCPEAHVEREERLKPVAKQIKQDSGGMMSKCKPELFRNVVHSFLGRSKEPDFTNNIELLSALLSDSETQTLNDILRKAFHKIGYPKLFDDFGMKTGQSEFSVKQIALIKLIAPNLKSLLSGSGDESELLKFISWVQEIEKHGFCFIKHNDGQRSISPILTDHNQFDSQLVWDLDSEKLKELRSVVKGILERKPKCFERSSLGGYLHDLTQHLYKLMDDGQLSGLKFSDLKELGACLVLESYLKDDSIDHNANLLFYRNINEKSAIALDKIKELLYSRPMLEKGNYFTINLKSAPWLLSFFASNAISFIKAIACLSFACLKAPIICCSNKNPEVMYEQFCDRDDVSTISQNLKSCAQSLRCGLNFLFLKPINIAVTGCLNFVLNGPLFICFLLKAAILCEMLEFLSDVKKQANRYIRSYPDVVLIGIFDFICFMQSDLEVLRMFKDDKPRYDYTIYTLSLLFALPALYYLLKTMCWDHNSINSKLGKIIESDSFDREGATVFRDAIEADMDVCIDINAGPYNTHSSIGKQRPLLSEVNPKINS